MARTFPTFVLVLSVVSSAPTAAATFTVSTANDAGVGSFRWAIDQTNLSPGPHRIVFAIPSSGVQTIHLLSDLASIQHTTAIDGTTQPSYNGVPLIEIDGTGSSNSTLITATASHSSVKGLTLNRYPDTALSVTADACTVSACYIGLTADGSAPSPNGAFGVRVTGSHVLIGGHFPAFRNVISGNNAGGIAIHSPAFADSVLGNYIGTNASGTAAVPSQLSGIESNNSRGLVIGGPGVDGNLISGNGDGILHGSTAPPPSDEGLAIYGNLIGTDLIGRNAIPNQLNGVSLYSSFTTIGGVGKGNVISGNKGHGIYIAGPYSNYNRIFANKIGVGADGGTPLGNLMEGILIEKSYLNIVGGMADSGNQIGANVGNGVVVTGAEADGNTIMGNAIGTSFNGAQPLGNGQSGINLDGDQTIVGDVLGRRNIIARNQHGGVRVYGERNTLRGNAIFSNNLALGINLWDMSGGPITPNDSLDADSGPNFFQNHPVLTAISIVGNQVRLQGRLSTRPNWSFDVDLYSNAQCSTYGYGEGESWLGSVPVSTNAAGLALFDESYPLTSVVGWNFTCTATSYEGNTSEFSPCASIAIPTAVEGAHAPRFALSPGLPSPARGHATLSFTLAWPSRVSLHAYDVAGRAVADLLEADLPAGLHSIPWSLDEIRSGVYFCRLRALAIDRIGESQDASCVVVVAR